MAKQKMPKPKSKTDLQDLKQEVSMDEHRIPIEELMQRHSSNLEKV
jgi:hypothetical protein